MGDSFGTVFLQGDGAWPPSGGQNSWPHPGELSVWLQWFYSAPLSRTAGCDLGRCGTAKADFIEKPKAFWEALIKSAGCFWFTLLSLYTLNSKISLLKLGLFVFSGNMWFNGAGGIQQSFAIPKQDIIFLLRFMRKKIKNCICPSFKVCVFLLLFSLIQSRTKEGGKRISGKWKTIGPGARLKSSMWAQ